MVLFMKEKTEAEKKKWMKDKKAWIKAKKKIPNLKKALEEIENAHSFMDRHDLFHFVDNNPELATMCLFEFYNVIAPLQYLGEQLKNGFYPPIVMKKRRTRKNP